MVTLLPPKKQVALALLERSSVFIHLDPRDERVRVPRWFKNQPQLVLQIGLNMAVRIPDLDIDEDAISCTLSFSRSPHFCYVPWTSIYALVGEDGRGMVWPEDVPAEVASQSNSTPPPRPRNSLRPIAGEGKGTPSEHPKPKLRSVPPPPLTPADDTQAGVSFNGRVDSISSNGSFAGNGAKRAGEPRSTPPSSSPPRPEEVAESWSAAYEGIDAPGSFVPTAHDLERPTTRPTGRSKRPLPSYLRVVK